MFDHESRYEGWGSGTTIFGFIIFFLVLAAIFWNGSGLNQKHSCDKQDYLERGVAEMKHTMTSQNGIATAQLETAIRALMKNSDDNRAAIVDNQKDMYIRQLEQRNQEMFITAQNEATRNLIDKQSAAQMFAIQSGLNQVNSRISSVECQMVKNPAFIPFGGLASIGCNNGRSSCCGNEG